MNSEIKMNSDNSVSISSDLMGKMPLENSVSISSDLMEEMTPENIDSSTINNVLSTNNSSKKIDENVITILSSCSEDTSNYIKKMSKSVNDSRDLRVFCSTIELMMNDINDLLVNLKNIKCLNVPLPSVNELLKDVCDSKEKLNTKAENICAYFGLLEKYYTMMSEGGNDSRVDDIKNALTSFNEVNNDEISLFDYARKYSVFWIVNEALKNSNMKGFSFAFDKFTYGVDCAYDGGIYTVGDLSRNIIEDYLKREGISSELLSAGKSINFGASASVFLYSLCCAISEHDGKLYKNDLKRDLVKASSEAVGYYAWNQIVDAQLGKVLLGALGMTNIAASGVLTVALAAVGSRIFLEVYDKIGDVVIGDDIIAYGLSKNGDNIPIYRNGLGENGSTECIIKKYDECPTRFYQGRNISDRFYKEMLYSDFENVYNSSVTYQVYSKADWSYNTFIEEILPMIESSTSLKEVDFEMLKFFDNPNNEIVLNHVGFDYREYYEYTHGSTDNN